MKKLLVLTLVLSMAAMANANLAFQVSSTEVYPSDNVTISLVSGTTPILGFSIDAIMSNNGGTASSGSFNSAFEVQYPGALNEDGALVEFLGATDTAPTPAPGVSGTLYSFVYHVPNVPASTIIMINAFGDDDYFLAPQYTVANNGGTFYGTQYFTPLVLHYVPEPMTMCLLGLGGLFLRRRSK